MEDNATEEQSDLGPYCFQYKLHNINSKLHKNIQQTREGDDKWLNNISFEKKLNYANCITVILIYVCFAKQMCKL